MHAYRQDPHDGHPTAFAKTDLSTIIKQASPLRGDSRQGKLVENDATLADENEKLRRKVDTLMTLCRQPLMGSTVPASSKSSTSRRRRVTEPAFVHGDEQASGHHDDTVTVTHGDSHGEFLAAASLLEEGSVLENIPMQLRVPPPSPANIVDELSPANISLPRESRPRASWDDSTGFAQPSDAEPAPDWCERIVDPMNDGSAYFMSTPRMPQTPGRTSLPRTLRMSVTPQVDCGGSSREPRASVTPQIDCSVGRQRRGSTTPRIDCSATPRTAEETRGSGAHTAGSIHGHTPTRDLTADLKIVDGPASTPPQKRPSGKRHLRSVSPRFPRKPPDGRPSDYPQIYRSSLHPDAVYHGTPSREREEGVCGVGQCVMQ
jgi:hypothetical protein